MFLRWSIKWSIKTNIKFKNVKIKFKNVYNKLYFLGGQIILNIMPPKKLEKVSVAQRLSSFFRPLPVPLVPGRYDSSSSDNETDGEGEEEEDWEML